MLSLLIATLTTLPPAATPAADDGPDLFRPYSLMTTLDPATRRAIDARHRETLDAVRALREREREDILAMLSDEQRADLAAVEARLREELSDYNRRRRATTPQGE